LGALRARVGGAMKSTLVLAAMAVAMIMAGCATTGSPRDDLTVPPAGERGDLDSVALIDQAFAAGNIDYTTSLLYKVYAMFDPTSLPAEFASDVPAKCGTPLIQEVQRNWHRFTPEEQAEIGVYIQPIRNPDEPVDTDLDDVTKDHLDSERERERID
jgi:hypothetical protein